MPFEVECNCGKSVYQIEANPTGLLCDVRNWNAVARWPWDVSPAPDLFCNSTLFSEMNALLYIVRKEVLAVVEFYTDNDCQCN